MSDNRSKAHYARDVRGSEGMLVGPNGFGERLVVDEVQWDGERSTAFFRNATKDDLPPVEVPSLTKAQIYQRFWTTEARPSGRFMTDDRAKRKEAKRLIREARGGLSKRAFARASREP